MRVVLREDLENLGQAGEVVSVRDGYGRNYLLPRGLAATASERDVTKIAHEKRTIAARVVKLAKELASQVDKLSQVSVKISAAVGEEDKLYGSVGNRDIADALKEAGHAIDAKKILLEEPIKTLGHHEVSIKLGKDAVAKIRVSVVKKS